MTSSPPSYVPAAPRLFEPARIGDIAVANRVVMAPLTRSRADEAAGDLPGSALHVAYYRQRAGAGLVVSEGTQVAAQGKGYPATPGIYSEAQVAGWRAVTDAVHEAGGKIVAQLWHVGRITHPALTGGLPPVAPSAIALPGTARTPSGRQALPTPHALSTAEVGEVVQQFRRAADNALRAGFDGVEIHGANGYLIDQFLRDGSNQRQDRYGGSIERRLRFALEVVDAVVAQIGAGRTGIRLSPVIVSDDIHDSDPQALFGALVQALDRRAIAFIHFVEGALNGSRDAPGFDYAWARRHFRGSYIANNGYTGALAADAVQSGRADAVQSGRADAVAFGRLFIANPDLVQRLKAGAALNTPDPSTYYSPGPQGYTDYPAL